MSACYNRSQTGAKSVWVCHWGGEAQSVKGFWSLLGANLTADLLGGVRKVKRVQQRGGLVRFDLFLDPLLSERVRQALGTLRGFSKEHVPWGMRERPSPAGGVEAGIGPGPALTGILSCSYNVRGLHGKRHEIANFLVHSKCAVLALQETGLESKHWKLRVNGFRCTQGFADPSKSGGRGVALLVDSAIPAFDLGQSSPNYCFQKIMIKAGTQCSVIIGSVYVPGKGPERRKVIKSLAVVLKSLRGKYPTVPIACLGDWNTKPARLAKLTVQIGGGFSAVPVTGDARAFHRRGRPVSAIDHVLVPEAWASGEGKVRVHRQYDLSDHWPIFFKIPVSRAVSAQSVPRVQSRLNPAAVTKAMGAIATHNMWEVLATWWEDDDTNSENGGKSVEEMAKEFQEVSQSVALDTGLMESAAKPKTGPAVHLSVTIKSQIGKRRKLWKAVVNAANPNEAEKAWRLYSEGRRATHARIARERTASWRKFIAKGVDQIAENDMRGYWKFVNHVTGRRQERREGNQRLSTLCRRGGSRPGFCGRSLEGALSCPIK